MKIGILTYHRADNYGAVLQTLALYYYLKKNYSSDVSVIDYWPKYHSVVYESTHTFWSEFKIIAKRNWFIYFIKNIKYFKRLTERKINFNKFRNTNLVILPSCTKYDIVFYGSDIIWHYWSMNDKFNGYDPVYWGNNQICSRYKFSYSASMGEVRNDEQTKQFCLQNINNFNSIAVREKQLQEQLLKWGVKEVFNTIDPTLLLTKTDWQKFCSPRLINEEYILCYNLERSNLIAQIADKIAHEKGYRVISLTGRVMPTVINDVMDTIGPAEFLSLLRYSSVVLTSSFHGVVFSIIFHKEFYFNSKVQTERIESLLHLLNIEDRFITNISDIERITSINYTELDTILNDYKIKSKEYLNNCIHLFNN